jgi:biuret amidohydrolase
VVNGYSMSPKFSSLFGQPGGFGESLGNDVSLLQCAVQPCKHVLDAARQNNLLIIHTREGHRKELSNLHQCKFQRPGAPPDSGVIGRAGPKGRILVQGEPGHDIIPELYPQTGEPIIDKPGKGSFYATDLDCILKAKGIETLIVCGVTTEVCVHTTIREGRSHEISLVEGRNSLLRIFDYFIPIPIHSQRPRFFLHHATRLLRIVQSRVP